MRRLWPESFIAGRDGTIAYELVGPITPENIETVLEAEIEKARTKPSTPSLRAQRSNPEIAQKELDCVVARAPRNDAYL